MNTSPNPPCPILASRLKLFVAVASCRYENFLIFCGGGSSASGSDEDVAGLATHTMRVCITCYTRNKWIKDTSIKPNKQCFDLETHKPLFEIYNIIHTLMWHKTVTRCVNNKEWRKEHRKWDVTRRRWWLVRYGFLNRNGFLILHIITFWSKSETQAKSHVCSKIDISDSFPFRGVTKVTAIHTIAIGLLLVLP